MEKQAPIDEPLYTPTGIFIDDGKVEVLVYTVQLWRMFRVFNLDLHNVEVRAFPRKSIGVWRTDKGLRWLHQIWIPDTIPQDERFTFAQSVWAEAVLQRTAEPGVTWSVGWSNNADPYHETLRITADGGVVTPRVP